MTEEFKDKDINLGLEKLKAFMEPGEIFIGNYRSDHLERGVTGGPVSAGKIGVNLLKTGQYSSVRILPFAYSRNGEMIPEASAILVTPKPQE